MLVFVCNLNFSVNNESSVDFTINPTIDPTQKDKVQIPIAYTLYRHAPDLLGLSAIKASLWSVTQSKLDVDRQSFNVKSIKLHGVW